MPLLRPPPRNVQRPGDPRITSTAPGRVKPRAPAAGAPRRGRGGGGVLSPPAPGRARGRGGGGAMLSGRAWERAMASDDRPLVGVLMGSKSDWETMKHASETFARFGVAHECRVLSAHRTPAATVEYVRRAEERGIEVLIAAAGGAAPPRHAGRDHRRAVGGAHPRRPASRTAGAAPPVPGGAGGEGARGDAALRFPPPNAQLLWGLAAALLIGTLVGIEREKSKGLAGKIGIGGVRTFILFSLTGAVAAWLSQLLGSPLVFAVAIAGVSALVVAGHVVQARTKPEAVRGPTQEGGPRGGPPPRG